MKRNNDGQNQGSFKEALTLPSVYSVGATTTTATTTNTTAATNPSLRLNKNKEVKISRPVFSTSPNKPIAESTDFVDQNHTKYFKPTEIAHSDSKTSTPSTLPRSRSFFDMRSVISNTDARRTRSISNQACVVRVNAHANDDLHKGDNTRQLYQPPYASLNAILHNDDNISVKSNVTAFTNNLRQDLMQSIYNDNLSLSDHGISNKPSDNYQQNKNKNNSKMFLLNDEHMVEEDIHSDFLSADPVEHDPLDDLFLKLPSLDSHTTQYSTTATYKDKDFLILTSAGKPIFSMKHDLRSDMGKRNMDNETGGTEVEEDDNALYGISGMINTIVEFFKINTTSQLRSFQFKKNNGSNKVAKFVFLDKNPVVLMAYSELEYESELHLSDQLDFLYSYLLCTLSKNKLDKLFNKRDNFDLRNFLSEYDFHNLLEICKQICFQFHPQFLFSQSSSLQIFPMKKTFREKLHSVMLANYYKSLNFGNNQSNNEKNEIPKSLLYGMIVSFPNTQLVSILRPKNHSLHTTDLHLLFQLIKFQYYNKNNSNNKDWKTHFDNLSISKESTSENEYFKPICFPKFNSNGFLYCYINFFQNDGFLQNSIDSTAANTFALVLISSNKNSLNYCKHLNELIQEGISFEATNLLRSLSKKLENNNKNLSDFEYNSKESFNSSNMLASSTSLDNINSRASSFSIGNLPRSPFKNSTRFSSNLLSNPPGNLELLELPNVYHFIYKSKSLVQHVTPQVTENLMHHYLFLQSQVKNIEGQLLNKKTTLIAVKIILNQNNSHNNTGENNKTNLDHKKNMFIMGICWVTNKFELYILGNPNFNNKKELLASGKKIIQWCSKNEQRLFIKDGAVF